MAAGEKILRVIIAGDALGAVGALESLSHGLERAHSDADTHGGGIVSSLGGAAKTVGMFAVGATAAVGAIGAEIFHISSQYEQNLNAIQAFTHSTNEQMKGLENQLYSMSPKFAQMGQTVSDASEALYELTKAGASSKDGMAELIPTMALAKATNTDYSEAAKEMTRVLNSFGLQAKDATMVSDVLTNATHTSTQTLQDMADGLKYVSVAAHDYGIDLKTTSAVMAMYANAGIQGTNAGTAFRQMLLNLSAPTTRAKEAIAAIGLKAFDAKGQMEPLGVIFQQLQDKFGKGLDTHSLEKIAPYLKDIFGARGVEPILAAIRQGGGGLQQYIDLMNRTGEASAIAQAKSKGLSGTFNTLKATMESATQHLYMQVAPKLANFLNPFVDALPGYLSKAAEFGSELFGALTDPKAAHEKAQKSGDAVLGVLATVGESARSILGGAASGIAGFVSDVVLPMAKDIAPAFAATLPLIQSIGQDIGRAVLPALRDIGAFVKNDFLPVFHQVAGWMTTVLIPGLQKLWTDVEPYLVMLSDFFEKQLVPVLEDMWQKAKPIIGDLENAIASTVTALGDALNFLRPIVQWVIDTFSGPLTRVVKIWVSGIVEQVRGVIHVFQGIMDFLSGVFTGDWSKAWNGIKEIFSGAWMAIKGMVIAGMALLIAPISDGLKWIRQLWDECWAGVVKFFSQSWYQIGIEVGKAIGNVVRFFVVDLPKGIGRAVANAYDWLKSAGKDAMTGLAHWIDSSSSAVWDWFKALPGKVAEATKDAGKWLYDAGVHMVEGLMKGIGSMAGKAMDSIKSFGSGLAKGFGSVLGISSPSKVFAEFGGHVGQGFINGVVAKTSAVHDAVIGMVAVPKSRFTDVFQQQQQTATAAAATAARSAGQVWATSGAIGPAGSGNQSVNVTINVAGSIQAERDFARTMSTAIRDQIRQIGRQNGGQTGLTGIGV